MVVRTLAILPNLNIVSGGQDGTIKIWTMLDSDFSYRNNLIGHTGPINDLKFINNQNLASCSSDNSIRVWDMNTNQTKSINSIR